MARRGRQASGQLLRNWPLHPFLEFPDDLPDRSSFASRLTTLMSKKIIIPHDLSWKVADEFGLTT